MVKIYLLLVFHAQFRPAIRLAHQDYSGFQTNAAAIIFNIVNFYARRKRQEITNVGKDVKKRELSCTVGENVNCYSYYCSTQWTMRINCPRSVQFSPSAMSNSLRPHGLQHTTLPGPSPSPRTCSNSCPLSQ